MPCVVGDVQAELLCLPARRRQEPAQSELRPECHFSQPPCHIPHCNRIEFEIELPLETRLDHRPRVLETQLLYAQARGRVARGTLPYQPRRDRPSIHSAATGAAEPDQPADAAGSDAAFLASSFSTIYIIGEGAVSAFRVPTVRWRSTASL